MTKLTLTLQERNAIDWIGGRYAHGHDLDRLLLHCTQEPDDAEWQENVDITYFLDPIQVYTLRDIIEEDNLACFGPELQTKLKSIEC